MEILKENSINKIFQANKNSLLYILRIFIFSLLCYSIFICVLRRYIDFVISFIALALVIYLTYKIIKADLEQFNIYFLVIYFFFLIVYIINVLISAYVQGSFFLSLKVFYHAAIVNIQFIITRFNFDKKTNIILGLSYSSSLIFIFFICYINKGSEDVLLELAFLVFIIWSINSYLYNMLNFFNDYVKTIFKNEWLFKKFQNIFNNLKTPLIMINLSKFKLEVNTIFKHFIKILDLTDQKIEDGFFKVDEEEIKDFKKNTMKTKEFISFKEVINVNLDENAISPEKLKKRLIFFKQLFYIYKILMIFKQQNKEKQNLFSSNTSHDAFAAILNSKFFEENEIFENLGLYKVDSKRSTSNCTIETSLESLKFLIMR